MVSVQIIMEKNYCILSAFDEDAHELAGKVQDLLEQGWIISGGIASLNSKLYQTMVKGL
jgi:hypothetical protein